MKDSGLVPPATDAVWAALRGLPELAGFVLIGGTAMAMQVRHRVSDDLDLACKGIRLPRDRVERAIARVIEGGLSCARHDDPTALEEFSDGGMDLRDYQQDYIVGEGVKVSFFAPDAPTAAVLLDRTEAGPRVATLDEIFWTKCLATARRAKARDWFDLFVLMRDHGYTLRAFLDTFERVDSKASGELGLLRLCDGKPQRADEGFQALLEAPPSLEEIQAFFRRERDALEVGTAAERSRR